MKLDEIRKDLDFLSGGEAVIFGSYATDEMRPGSDIDVAVITREESEEKNIEIQRDLIGKARPRYDIKVFETMPLQLKASIMDEYIILFGEEPEISYYFYHFRKIWEDCKHRIMEGYHDSYKGKVESINRGKSVRSRIKDDAR